MLYNNVSVKQVDVPSFSGSFGILPAHVPTLAVLKPGVVTVYENDGAAKKFFVSSGTVTINEDSSGNNFNKFVPIVYLNKQFPSLQCNYWRKKPFQWATSTSAQPRNC